MIFYIIGIDYKTVEFTKREKAGLLKKNFIQFLDSNGFNNARLLSTCNRFEVYDFAEDKNEAFYKFNIVKKNFNYLFGNSYAFFGEKEVFGHLLKLGCGLESQLKAEGQILEQLANFHSQKDFPENLKKITDAAIFSAGAIRAKVWLDKKMYNIADLVLEDIIDKTARVSPLKIVIVGTGKIAELFVSIRAQVFQFYFLAHKNYIKANELAKKVNGKAVSLHKIDEVILEADVLISATNSPHYILTAEFFKKVMAQRKKVLYIYDLAIPRDIEPSVFDINGIILKNMDDLEPLFEKYNQAIRKELLVLEVLIQEEAEKYEVSYEANVEDGYKAKFISASAG